MDFVRMIHTISWKWYWAQLTPCCYIEPSLHNCVIHTGRQTEWQVKNIIPFSKAKRGLSSIVVIDRVIPKHISEHCCVVVLLWMSYSCPSRRHIRLALFTYHHIWSCRYPTFLCSPPLLRHGKQVALPHVVLSHVSSAHGSDKNSWHLKTLSTFLNNLNTPF